MSGIGDGNIHEVGVKHDKDKLRMDLIPVSAIEAIAEVLTYGAKKYADRNWERGLKWSRVFGATMRHLWAWYRGEDVDRESGLSHLSHAACNVVFLIEYAKKRKEFDDRPLETVEDTKTISDGFGSTWSAICPECGGETMQVVRPGKIQCYECG